MYVVRSGRDVQKRKKMLQLHGIYGLNMYMDISTFLRFWFKKFKSFARCFHRHHIISSLRFVSYAEGGTVSFDETRNFTIIVCNEAESLRGANDSRHCSEIDQLLTFPRLFTPLNNYYRQTKS